MLSSRIEGTQSDVTDLLRFEAGDEESIGELHDDVREVRNYITALDHGIGRLEGGFPLSMRLLRETHERLMSGVRGGYATPGEFRRSQNWIGGSSPSDAAFVPPPVDAMHVALDDLEQFLHDRSLPLLVHLAMAHYQFEVIHPFLDGNGRLGRLLIPLVMIEREVLPQPLLYLSVHFEQHRNGYYDLLMSTSRTGDLAPWIKFFLRRPHASTASDHIGIRSGVLCELEVFASPAQPSASDVSAIRQRQGLALRAWQRARHQERLLLRRGGPDRQR